MRKALLFFAISLITFSSIAQVISYELVESFTVDELIELREDIGVPETAIEPLYPVDLYKVLYLTPYKNMDTWVQASGLAIYPSNVDCPLPITVYHHGTQAKKSSAASNLNGGQWDVCALYASTGYIMALPDYLGLGDADTLVKIHPYQHQFSQGNTSLNMIRATREIAEEESFDLNNQLFLFGYSQGGFATMATHRLIQEEYPLEFDITASAPMAGAYDMGGAQADLIGSDSPYPTPGYLPYLILAFEDQYGNMFDDASEAFVSPFDSVLPPLYYSGENSIGFINGECTPVPKDMITEEQINDFFDNPDNPFRLNLEDNDQLNWAPEGPVKLFYCEGDDQVSYMNSVNAYESWTANGSTEIEKQDFGPFNHFDCANFCFLGGKVFFDERRDDCSSTGIAEHDDVQISTFPNPTADLLYFKGMLPGSQIQVFDISGRVLNQQQHSDHIATANFENGLYFYELSIDDQVYSTGKFNVAR